MAFDILNTTNGTASGNQVLGKISVNTGGRGAFLNKVYSPSTEIVTATVTGISDKYDTKYDDPRYYQGDAIT